MRVEKLVNSRELANVRFRRFERLLPSGANVCLGTTHEVKTGPKRTFAAVSRFSRNPPLEPPLFHPHSRHDGEIIGVE